MGATPTNDNEVANRLVTNTLLASATPNRASVQAQVDALTSGATPTYASKSYVDTQDAAFQLVSYYQTQDALNVATTAKGAANGVASLDSSGKVPAAQIPTLGSGYVQGPYGPTATFTGTTTATPLKIADWNIGVVSLAQRPLVFMQCFVTGLVAHPVIEVRIANTTSSPAYGSTTLVAQGLGRGLYNDYHAVAVVPCPDSTGQTYSNLSTTYNIWLTAWLYDLSGNTGGVTISSGGVVSGAALILRGAL